MQKVSASDFFQFIKENVNAKKELMENLEKHNLLSLEKNKQEDVMLDVMMKLAQKYNFDIDKSDLKKSLNEGIAELDDDQLLKIAGGFGLFPWGLLLLQLLSSGGTDASTFFSSKSAEPTTKTAIVQSYDEQEETDLSDLKFNFKDNDDNVGTNNNTPSGDIDLGTPKVETQQNAENKIDDNEPSNIANTDLPKVDVQQSVENKTDDNDSGGDNIIADYVSDVEDNSSAENEDEITNDTTEAEINFSLKLLENLPKEGEPDFDDFLRLPSVEDLEENKEVTIRHKDGSSETLNINEKEVYKDIENIVHEIVHKVESRTPEENMSQEDIDLKINNKEISKHYKLPKQMRIAKAIYRWVASNIHYDEESNEKDSDGNSLRKPQNALFVFNQRKGVCAGYAALTNLMMRIAGIPSGCIYSGEHAYNVTYLLKDNIKNRQGWLLMDSTWGASDKESLIRSNQAFMAPVFDNGSNDLSHSIYERLKAVNVVKDPEKMDKVEEYIARVQAIVASIIQKYSDNISDNVDKINAEIQAELYKINLEFPDIVTFENFIVFKFSEKDLLIFAKNTLSPQEAENIANIQLKDLNIKNDSDSLSSMKNFFPGFYNKDVDFTTANISMLKNPHHRIEVVGNSSTNDYYETREYNLKIGEVEYELKGNDGDVHIKMEGEDSFNRLENVQIPSYLVDLGLPFEIGEGISSIILNGNETIDTFHLQLEDINTENSNKYVAEDGILYAKNANGSKGEILAVFKMSGEINGINYHINMDYKDNKIIGIEIYKKGGTLENVKVPEQLAQFNVPIKIGSGITSITLTDNQTIDKRFSPDLKRINIENSNKYIVKNDILYEKNTDNSIGKRIFHFKKN